MYRLNTTSRFERCIGAERQVLEHVVLVTCSAMTGSCEWGGGRRSTNKALAIRCDAFRAAAAEADPYKALAESNPAAAPETPVAPVILCDDRVGLADACASKSLSAAVLVG